MNEPKSTRSSQEIIDFILERLGQMSRRPHMYGGTAEGVDLCYWNYLELWAFAADLVEQMSAASTQAYRDLECGAMGFPHYFRQNNPGATDKAAIKFVVQQWLAIAATVGVPIPWEAIDADLAELQDYIPDWWQTDDYAAD